MTRSPSDADTTKANSPMSTAFATRMSVTPAGNAGPIFQSAARKKG